MKKFILPEEDWRLLMMLVEHEVSVFKNVNYTEKYISMLLNTKRRLEMIGDEGGYTRLTNKEEQSEYD